MNTGNVDDVNPPRAMKNIVQEVMDYVQNKLDDDVREKIKQDPPIVEGYLDVRAFKTYDEALHTIWPELYKASPQAHLLVAVSIYIEIAERWDFKDDILEILKGLKL